MNRSDSYFEIFAILASFWWLLSYLSRLWADFDNFFTFSQFNEHPRQLAALSEHFPVIFVSRKWKNLIPVVFTPKSDDSLKCPDFGIFVFFSKKFQIFEAENHQKCEKSKKFQKSQNVGKQLENGLEYHFIVFYKVFGVFGTLKKKIMLTASTLYIYIYIY